MPMERIPPTNNIKKILIYKYASYEKMKHFNSFQDV